MLRVCTLLASWYHYLFLQRQLPFAVVGSREEADVGGRKVRCRSYPWGVVEGQSASSCCVCIYLSYYCS